MADYKETNISGTAWQRAQIIIISNHFEQPQTVTYQEEQLLNVDGGHVQRPAGSLSYQLDLTGHIALRDPDTLELTGESIPVALVYQAVLSDYITRAQDRDAVPAPPPEL